MRVGTGIEERSVEGGAAPVAGCEGRTLTGEESPGKPPGHAAPHPLTTTLTCPWAVSR